jgi:hypothetical protein
MATHKRMSLTELKVMHGWIASFPDDHPISDEECKIFAERIKRPSEQIREFVEKYRTSGGCERRGAKRTEEDHTHIDEWLLQHPLGHVIQDVEYEEMGRIMKRTPRAIQCSVLSKAARGSPLSTDSQFGEFVKKSSQIFHLKESELRKFVVSNEKKKSEQKVKRESKVKTSVKKTRVRGNAELLSEIKGLREEVSRLTSLVSQLQK